MLTATADTVLTGGSTENSSVLIAAFVGARYLGEGQALRRMVAASVVLVGLLLLVVGQ